MSKSLKELAFLRDLSIAKDWTERFTNFADKKVKFPKDGNILYFNSGTLSHSIELREKLDEKKINLTVISDDEEGWGKRSSAATEIFCPGGSSS